MIKHLWTVLHYKICLVVLCLAIYGNVVSQNVQTTSGPEMATGFYAEGKIYVVIGVIVIILAGLFIFLVRIDRRITKMENDLKK